MTIYTTNEWSGHGKQNYHWNEYRIENGMIVRYKCHRQKVFDSHESSWAKSERVDASWAIGDPNIPDWLKKIHTTIVKRGRAPVKEALSLFVTLPDLECALFASGKFV